MKKIIPTSIFMLPALILFMACLQSCVAKKEYEVPDNHCRACKAIRDGVEVDHTTACTTDQENSFRSANTSATVRCE